MKRVAYLGKDLDKMLQGFGTKSTIQGGSEMEGWDLLSLLGLWNQSSTLEKSH